VFIAKRVTLGSLLATLRCYGYANAGFDETWQPPEIHS
jgi:hypothetical protein